MTTPATENRNPHISPGGIVCTAISIARYVDPQNRYTSPKARITIHRLGRATDFIVVRNRGTLKDIRRQRRGRGFLSWVGDSNLARACNLRGESGEADCVAGYFSFSYSALAVMRTGRSGSASFHMAKKS